MIQLRNRDGDCENETVMTTFQRFEPINGAKHIVEQARHLSHAIMVLTDSIKGNSDGDPLARASAQHLRRLFCDALGVVAIDTDGEVERSASCVEGMNEIRQIFS